MNSVRLVGGSVSLFSTTKSLCYTGYVKYLGHQQLYLFQGAPNAESLEGLLKVTASPGVYASESGSNWCPNCHLGREITSSLTCRPLEG